MKKDRRLGSRRQEDYRQGTIGLASGDSWNDRDDIGLLDRGLFFLKEADILVVHKDIHEATYDAVFIDDALAQTWIGSIELVQNDAERGAGDRDLLEIIG
jgi:hypothetical protein